MKPSGNQQLGPILTIGLMALVLGLLGSVAWIKKDQRENRLRALSPEMRERVSLGEIDLSEELEKNRSDLTRLREENTKLQNMVANNQNASKVINESLQELKTFAGLTEVTGEGVTIMLTDSKRPLDQVLDANENLIHDQDLVSVLNELWNAGAEAISVNDKRIGPGSWVRCAGTRILVDSVQVAAPVVIRSIGNSKDLYNSMNMPGGYLDQLRQADPAMVRIEISKELNLPAYSGSTERKTLTVSKPKENN